MSLIILDTKMPIGDEVLVIRSDGTCTKREAAEVAFFGRAKKRRPTMIQTLKPHGRLIDASEKVTVHYDEHIKKEMTIDELLRCSWIDAKAPTIVPAENGNDEHGETTKKVQLKPCTVKTLCTKALIPPDANGRPKREIIQEKSEVIKQSILYHARDYIFVNVRELPEGYFELSGSIRISVRKG